MTSSHPERRACLVAPRNNLYLFVTYATRVDRVMCVFCIFSRLFSSSIYYSFLSPYQGNDLKKE